MRNRRNPILLLTITVVLLAAGIGALSWQNYRFAKNNRGANEFLVHWVSARTFLTQGTSPYSDETAAKIETAAYGHPAGKGEQKLRVVYPLYSIAVFIPFALIPDLASARAAYMTVLEICLIALTIISIRLARWRLRFWELGLFFLFGLFSYHSIQPLLDGNVTILVAMLVAGALIALKNGGDELAGVLLAFATIKPNVVALLIIYVLVWAALSHRNRLIGWLLGTLFILSAAAALLQPDWIWQNFREVVTFPSHSAPATPGAILGAAFPAMGQRLARIFYGALAGMVVTEWWLNRRAEFPGFYWTALFTLTLSQWIGIPTSPQNFIILLPALALVFATLEERWRRAGRVIAILSIVALLVGLWALYFDSGANQLLLFFPLPAFLIVTLYWVRWWAIHPPSVWFDLIYMRENP